MIPKQDQETSNNLFRWTTAAYILFHSLSLLGFSAEFQQYLRALLLIFSLVWGLGYLRVSAPLILFVSWTLQFILNEQLVSSETALIGWLLLAAAAAEKKTWRETMRWTGWIVLAGIYFNSGWSKCFDPGWQSGSTLQVVFASGLNRWPLLAQLGEGPLWIMAWSMIAMQILAPLALVGRWGRFAIWWSNFIFHVVTLAVLRVEQVSWAFIALHLFVYSRELLPIGARPFFVKK